MNGKKKIILIIVIAIIIIMCLIVNRTSNSKKENENMQEENNKKITSEELKEMTIEKIKEDLEREGLRLKETGRIINTNLETEGMSYKVYLSKKESESYEIQIYQIDINLIRSIGTDIEDGEITIEGEKYWKSENIIIKLSENNSINQIITTTIK